MEIVTLRSSGALLSEFLDRLMDTLKVETNYANYYKLGVVLNLPYSRQNTQNVIKKAFKKVVVGFHWLG